MSSLCFYRDAKRQELLERKRKVAPPVVVAILPLSDVSINSCICVGMPGVHAPFIKHSIKSKPSVHLVSQTFACGYTMHQGRITEAHLGTAVV